MTKPPCMTLERLARFATGTLDPQSSHDTEIHLGGCGPCRDTLRSLRRDESLFLELGTAIRATREEAEATSTVGEGVAIDGYEVLEEIHRGGQGTVYRALQRSTHRNVALKVLLGGVHATPRDRYRFEREVDLAAGLRHPNIVTVFDSGLMDGKPYYTMEFIDGLHLDDYTRLAQSSERAKLELFLRICRAVSYAHQHGVIHRDLKPSNILVDEAGDPHILDFGLAKATGTPLQITATGQFMGTLAYASPEQLSSEHARISMATDVYSLGMMLYEQLTGGRPYDLTQDITSAIASITTTDPRDPKELAPYLDDDLRVIVLKALSKDPARRYSTAEGLARDIAHYLAGEPIESKRDSTWYVVRKRISRHRLVLGTTAAFVVVCALAGAAVIKGHLRTRSQQQKAALIQSVIQNILSAAGPQRMGGDVTLVQVLEEASGVIESRLAGAPDAQAAVHHTIGDTYRRLLMLDEAEPHLRAALVRYRTVDGDVGLDLARCLHDLGLVLSYHGRAEAIDLQTEGLGIRQTALKRGNPAIAESQRDLAVALVSRGDREERRAEAEALLTTALATFRRVHGDQHPDVAVTLYRFGELRRAQGRREEAEVFCRNALAIFDRLSPENAPRSLEIVLDLASLLQAERRFEEAETALGRAIDLTKKHFGEDKVPEILRRFARLRFAKEEFDASLEFSRQAVAQELQKWARRRPHDAAVLNRLGDRIREGEPCFVEAFRVLRRFRGVGDFSLARWQNGIAQIALKKDNAALAEALYRESLEIHCRLYGQDCPIRMRTLSMLGKLLFERGNATAALPLLQEVVATLTRLDSLQSEPGVAATALLDACHASLAARNRAETP